MKVMPGDIFGIIGPNGAGKTTFFNMCTGMYTPTKGNVYLLGEDVTGFSAEKVARKRMAAYVSEPAAVQVHECS